MKKENKILILSAVFLVAASAGLHGIQKANEGYPDIAFNTEANHFMAASNSHYDEQEEVTEVKIKTNAPDGTILFVLAQHPYTTNDLSQYAIVKNGKAKAKIKMSPSLAATTVPIEVMLDMEQNQLSKKALMVYGKNGENITGEAVFDNGNGYKNTYLTTEEFIFPNEEKYKNEVFNAFIYYNIISNYGDVFYSITPAKDGSWSEINITLTKQSSSEESWKTVTDEVLNGFYKFFEDAAKESGVIGNNDSIKITIYDNDGNILAQNY